MRSEPGRDILSAIETIVGSSHVTTDPHAMAPWLTDWRGRLAGRALALVEPGSTEEVIALVRLARSHGLPIVPQGGNTSMVAGAIPDARGDAVLLALRRLTRIRARSVADASITVEAGLVLQRLHEEATAMGLRFPLSLAAKGSATVGGLIATNAGGTQVLRFGPMRAQVLGIEAVLPDGALLNLLAPLRKDNRGYDLKQLLIGSEGTLGVVTAATLRLVPRTERSVGWVGLNDPESALVLLRELEALTGGAVESFELVPAAALALVERHIPGARSPLARPAPWNVLIEVAAARASEAPADLLATALAGWTQEGRLVDGVIAQNDTQARALWHIRESVPEAERKDGFAAKHDIAVPVSRMARFIVEESRAVEAAFPGTRVIAFGHLGDGNIHFNVRAPVGIDDRARLEQMGAAVSCFVHDQVVAAGGTISAEHGIGQTKLAEFARLAEPARVTTLRAIKGAIDPAGIMNPGKLVPLASFRPAP